jgi:aspartate aminotransferase-like enzyme
VALEQYATTEKAQTRYDYYADLGRYVRLRLRELGLPPLAEECCASPVITSFYPPDDEPAAAFVGRCESWGFHIGGQSGYLAEQRLVQLANMGTLDRQDFASSCVSNSGCPAVRRDGLGHRRCLLSPKRERGSSLLQGALAF